MAGLAVSDKALFSAQDWAIYLSLTVFQSGLTAYVVFQWFTRPMGSNPVLFVLFSFILFAAVGTFLARWLLLPRMREPVSIPPAVPGWKVGVVTTFVPGGESIEMLQRTLEGLMQMDYPHETWVLDEGDDPQVRALCDRIGANHWSRKGKPAYNTGPSTRFQEKCKHGNYNAFFDEIGFDRFEILVGFDPDHVPRREFLEKTLGFFSDPKVGFVQAPQIYYNQKSGFVARGAAEESYAYYGCTQRAAYGGGWPLVTGCHHSHRVSALREIGGFAVHDADDMLITFHYRRAGWKGIYTPQVLAEGLTPTDWPSYLKQQQRWARSVLDLKFRVLPWQDFGLPLHEKFLSFIHGLGYLQGVTILGGLAFLLACLVGGSPPAALDGTLFRDLLLLGLLFQACSFFFQRFFLVPERERGIHWRSGFLVWAKWPIILVALLEAVFARKVPYVLTSKKAAEETRWKQAMAGLALLWPHAVVLFAVLIAYIHALANHSLILGLHVWAWLFISASLATLLSALILPPPPYQDAIKPTFFDNPEPARPPTGTLVSGTAP